MSAQPTLREKLGVQSPTEGIEYFNIFIFGDAGTGKTYLAGTAMDSENTAPVLFLDVEGGTTTLRKRTDLDVKRITTYDMLKDVINEVYMDTEGYYKTIVLDSLTELQEQDMKQIIADRDERRPDLIDTPPSQLEWGINSTHMRSVVRALRDMPLNTIITALEKRDKDENGVVSILPNLPSKLAYAVPGFMDIVGYLSTAEDNEGKVVRQLQTQKTRRVVAKDCTSTLEPVVVSPSIPLIFTTIMEEGE